MPDIQSYLDHLKQKYPDQDDFRHVVEEILSDVSDYYDDREDYQKANVIERLLEPDRIIQFRITWQDTNGRIRTNRGWRVQHNNAMGPYKGGLRFHPNVTLDTFKFLAFEQTFKNALTGLQMGGGKGGADFNPKEFSEADIFNFCQAFMLEMSRYIGPETDIPAGDIGVGQREIGYLFGTYKKLTGRFDGAMTGKNPAFGGSCVRKEATGYGTVYFLEEALKHAGDKLKGKTCALSGAGNVAIYTAEKLLEKEARILTMSDSGGTIYFKDGLSRDDLDTIIEIKEKQHGSLKEVSEKCDNCTYDADKTPWSAACEIAIPAATQNEVGEDDAKTLKKNNVQWICEAANMPLTGEANKVLRDTATILPGKAVNAGGVAVSGLERTQNAEYMNWSAEKVDNELQNIITEIHNLCVEYSGDDQGRIDYSKGANIAGFKRVADALCAYGGI